jgi:hypothetical protein
VLDYYEHALWRGDAAWLNKEKPAIFQSPQPEKPGGGLFDFMGGKSVESAAPGGKAARKPWR